MIRFNHCCPGLSLLFQLTRMRILEEMAEYIAAMIRLNYCLSQLMVAGYVHHLDMLTKMFQTFVCPGSSLLIHKHFLCN